MPQLLRYVHVFCSPGIDYHDIEQMLRRSHQQSSAVKLGDSLATHTDMIDIITPPQKADSERVADAVDKLLAAAYSMCTSDSAQPPEWTSVDKDGKLIAL